MDDLRLAFRQLIEGEDFEPPGQLLGDISHQQASTVLPGWPYSIGTNVAHADHWQRIWLARLIGRRAPRAFPDFPAVLPDDWPNVREQFLQNLSAVQQIVDGEPFLHRMKDDARARKVLTQILLHDTYHLGQIKLLKRLLLAGPG